MEIRKVRVKRTGSQRTNASGDKEGAGKAHGLAAVDFGEELGDAVRVHAGVHLPHTQGQLG